jgi:rhodanese-related sulfurtransferase
LQIKDRDDFVRKMVENLPDRPQYFAHDVEMNLNGVPSLSSLPALRALGEAELSEMATGDTVIIDTRSAPFFGAGHFPGSLNIGLSSNLFATWVGFLVPFGKEIALVVGSAENAKKARLELARIGYDNVLGYIEADSLARTRQLSQLGVEELHFGLRRGEAPQVLDVRTAGEWDAGHIESAIHIPLPTLPRCTASLGKDSRLAIICGSGYRSSIAASLLQAQGFSRVQNVMGGMGAYLETGIPAWQPSDLVFMGENI